MSVIRVHLVGSVPVASIRQPISVSQQTACVILRRQLRPRGRFGGSFRGSDLCVGDGADSPRGCPEGPDVQRVVGGKKEELAQRGVGGGGRDVGNRGRYTWECLEMRGWREFHSESEREGKRLEGKRVVDTQEEESEWEMAGKPTGCRARSACRAPGRARRRRGRGGRRAGGWREEVCGRGGKQNDSGMRRKERQEWVASE